MRVEITDKKDDVETMTIEELAEKNFIGYVNCGGDKYFLVQEDTGDKDFIFRRLNFAGCWLGACGSGTKIDVLKRGTGVFYYFDTAKELFKWLSE